MLGRKVFDPVKVVLECDSAIDKSLSDYVSYRASWDEKHLKFVAGEQPVRFTLQQLTSQQKTLVEAQSTARDKAITTLRYALVAMSGYQFEHPDGSRTEAALAERVDTAQGKALPEATLHALNLPDEHLVPLWVACRELSEAAIPLSRS